MITECSDACLQVDCVESNIFYRTISTGSDYGFSVYYSSSKTTIQEEPAFSPMYFFICLASIVSFWYGYSLVSVFDLIQPRLRLKKQFAVKIYKVLTLAICYTCLIRHSVGLITDY